MFSQGLGCFNGFLVSMLVGYLLMKRKIVKMMSGYQVLRSTLQFLGEFPGVSSLYVKPENGREKGKLWLFSL